MQITLAGVISLNGKVTNGDDPDIHSWSSVEDWEHFVKLRDKHEVIVIDQETFEVVQPQAEQGKLRIILTKNPRQLADTSLPGQLEFVNLTPTSLANRLFKEGYEKVLVAGGSELCSGFLSAGLVDDIYITFEPVLFGTGRQMLGETPLNISLQLQSVKKLNERGTILSHYTVTETH